MRRIKKILLWILLFAAAVILFFTAVRAGFILKERKRIFSSGEITEAILTKETEPYDAILVLGCGVYGDGTLSPMLRWRLDTVQELWEGDSAPVIFVTGDHTDDGYDEVDHMIADLADRGIPRESMIADYHGVSTFESMKNAAAYFGENTGKNGTDPEDAKRILVVTQKYHLYRAMYIGEDLGLSCTGAIARDWKLSAGTAYRHLREIPGCVKDWLVCLFDR